MSASLCARRERESPAIHNIHALTGTSKTGKQRERGRKGGERKKRREKIEATKNEMVEMDCEM